MFDEVSDLYQSIILERSRNPAHMRRLENFDGCGHGENPLCGDKVEVRVARDAVGRVIETGFEARGCAISIASADLMAEAVAGRTSAEIAALATEFHAMVRGGAAAPGVKNLKALAGVAEYPSRIKCATLPWGAMMAALDGGKGEAQ